MKRVGNKLRIYYIKQKVIGLLCIILPFVFLDVLIKYEATITMVMLLPVGVYYLLAKEKLFRSDYIFDINLRGRADKGL